MQGLADGYFVIPSTVPNYLATNKAGEGHAEHDAVKEAVDNVTQITNRLLNAKGTQERGSLPPRAGQDHVGLLRHGAHGGGLAEGAPLIPELREEFWQNVRVLGRGDETNQELEKAGRLADFFELGELMCIDALQRNESCGGHFREEYQTEDGEALRNDDEYTYVSAWQYTGDGAAPLMHKEPLTFEYVKLATRSYK
jgi:succinate dehydrogenase / fumarate reductase flavoprotein subunit